MSADDPLDEEISQHVQLLTEQNLRAGMTPQEAARRARLQFGSVESLRQECRESRPGRWLRDLVHDLRYAIRLLRKSPGFTAAVIATVAVGIGAGTVILSAASALLLRPLPYRDPAALVTLRHGIGRGTLGQLSLPDFSDIRAQSRSLRDMTAFNQARFIWNADGAAETIEGMVVSANFWKVLGTEPSLGRSFDPDEDQPGKPPVAILSWQLWQRRLAGDPTVLGRPVVLDGRSFTVVGIAPREFRFPVGAAPAVKGAPGFVDLWLPLNSGMDVEARKWRGLRYLGVIARLAPGVTLAQANRELEAIEARLAAQHPKEHEKARVLYVTVLREDWLQGGQAILLLLLGAAGLLLLMVCANVANLQVARTTLRRHELTVRRALGASEGRLVRQLLAEGLLLAALGGGGGIALAMAFRGALTSLIPADIARFHEIGFDARVVLGALLATLVTGLITGGASAWAIGRQAGGGALATGHRATANDRARATLVVVQTAIALVLLIGGGLLARTFGRVLAQNPGFDPSGLLTARINLPARYDSGEKRRAFQRALDTTLAALPGSRGSTVTLGLPYSRWGGAFKLIAPGGDSLLADVHNVDGHYFDVLRVPLRAGRSFAAQDSNEDGSDRSAPMVGVVNQTLARLYWPNGDNPVGRRLKVGHWPGEISVIGVVSDTRRLDRAAKPELYLPLGAGGQQLFLAVRGDDTRRLADDLRAAVRDLAPDLPLSEVRTMTDALAESVAPRRLGALMLGLFAALALLVTTVGTYAVVAHTMAQRVREMAVRLALGARAGQVVRLVVRQGLQLTITGIGLGTLAALALTQLLGSQLYGVTATDRVSFGVAIAVVLSLGLLACLVPARRATRVAPMEVLRHD
jgi:putative ABC transport system permease protein